MKDMVHYSKISDRGHYLNHVLRSVGCKCMDNQPDDKCDVGYSLYNCATKPKLVPLPNRFRR